jgi:peptidoglycan L-alanyl-D-glutamate endopeptidase CwlK
MTKLESLHPKLQLLYLQHVALCLSHGIKIVIVQGTRTLAEQDVLYRQGRTLPGRIVTNAHGGHSYHNFGLAYDIALAVPNGTLSWDMQEDMNGDNISDFLEAGEWGEQCGLQWGGRFKTILDMPHFQYTFGFTLEQLRAGAEIPND